MRKRKTIWGREAAPRERGIHLVEDPTNLEPDALRDSVRDALSALTADELAAWRDHLLKRSKEGRREPWRVRVLDWDL